MQRHFEEIPLSEITEITHFLEFQEGDPAKVFKFVDKNGKLWGDSGYNEDRHHWELNYYSLSNSLPVMPNIKYKKNCRKYSSICGLVRAYHVAGFYWLEGRDLPFTHFFREFYDFSVFVRATEYKFTVEDLEILKSEEKLLCM